MSRKSVSIKMPVAKPAPALAADAWVKAPTTDVAEGRVVPMTTPAPAPAEPMKRFTIDVPEGLHKRVKAHCAMNGLAMADVIREFLEAKFPATAA